MVRQTSIEAYSKLIDDGIISKKRGDVLLFVAANPGCTALDCEDYYNPRNRSTINARFSELVKMGMIEEVGEKVQHGHKRITYQVTGITVPVLISSNKKASWKTKFQILLETCNDILNNPNINPDTKNVILKAYNRIGYIR